jgi:diguanylate cyclase (GGDEF)-like protein
VTNDRLIQPVNVCATSAFVVGLLIAVAATPQLGAQQSQPITQVNAIRALTVEQAGEGRAVDVRGVVTVVSGWKNSFFFEDATAGISVDRSASLPELHQGQQVEIQGVTSPGMFAPVISAREVKVLGDGDLSAAPLVDLDRLAGGKLDSQWITVKGNVRNASVKPSWGRPVLFLDVDVGGGTLVTARIRDFPDTGWERLPTSIVSIRGVCATTFNDKRQFIGLKLFVANLNDVRVLQPGPADPFDRPLRPLSALLRFDPKQDNIAPVRVRGTVTHLQPGQGIYIQDGPEGVLLRGAQTASIAVGDQIEAVGYPGGGDYSPSLENSLFRIIHEKRQAVALVTPVLVTASEMIVDNQGFSASPYDSRLVRIRGVLDQAISGVDERVLFVRDGTAIFTARLPAADSGNVPPIGSMIEVTGVCATRVDAGHEARSFRILLRNLADITVVQRAPWWNTAHSKGIVVLLLIVVVLLVGWLILLRREGRLRQLALTDPLTGLYNRRGFLLLADHQWHLALRKRAAFLLFFIDIDDFKSINDTLGHKEGDVALQVVASALRECFRKTDLIGRSGGDEFVVSAIDASPSSGEHLKQRLAEIVEQANKKEGRKFYLSLSVGMLVCDELSKGAGFEELLARADALMYERKRAAKMRGYEPDRALLSISN